MRPVTSRAPMALLLFVVLAVAAVLLLARGLGQVGPLPFSLVVDGQDITPQLGLAGLDQGERLLAAVVALLATVALLVFVPVMLVAGLALLLLMVGGIVLAAVGAPLLAVAAVLALLLSPLILAVLLLRWLLR